MPKLDIDGTIYNIPDEATQDQILAFALEKKKGQDTSNLERLKSAEDMGFNGRQLFDLPQNLLSGLIKGGQKLSSTLTSPFGLQQPELNADKLTGAEGKQGMGLQQGLGEFLPYAIAGGPKIAGQAAAGAAQGFTNVDPGILAHLAQMFGMNFGMTPGIGSKAVNALEGALPAPIVGGIAKGVNALRPSNLFRGNLSPQELSANLEAAGDTATGLGDVIGSPMLKRGYENILADIPFSGASQRLQQAGQEVSQKGNDILNSLLKGEAPENITDRLQSALIGASKKHQVEKNALYETADELANQYGVKIKAPEFSSKYRDYSEAIADSKALTMDPQLRKYIKKATDGDFLTLKEANLLKSKLGRLGNEAAKSPDPDKRHMAKIYNELSKAQKTDISNGLETEGLEEVKNAYQEAEKNYAKNFSSFLDKDIYKFTHGKADPDTLVQAFLKSGRSKAADRSGLLKKLSDKLPPEEKDLLAGAYFARALDKDGKLNTSKLSTLVKDLGPKQFKALVPDASARNEIKNYTKLHKMNERGVNIMENPATGHRNMSMLGLLPAIMGQGIGGVPGAVAGLMLPGLAARPIVNTLTSPSVRRNLVETMIANKQWMPPMQAPNALMQALMNRGQQ